MLSLLFAVAENPGQDESGGIGIALILIALLLAAIVIGGVWTFAAKRGSRVPRREPHQRDHVGH